MQARIYKATNKANGKAYVGYTQYSLEARKKDHIRLAEKGSNTIFHKAIRKYGPEGFVWETLEEGEGRQHFNNILEPRYIQEHETLVPSGYNIEKGGQGNPGHEVTPETRAKLRAANLGKVMPPEVRKKISDTQKGKPGIKHTEEAKKRMSESAKKRSTPEFRKKVSDTLKEYYKTHDNPFKGRKHSAETKRKLKAGWSAKKEVKREQISQ